MGIHFDNPVEKLGLRPVPRSVPVNERTSENGPNEGCRDSFSAHLKRASAVQHNPLPGSCISAKTALEFCRRLELKMNESLIGLLSDENPKNSDMDDVMSLLKENIPEKGKDTGLLSRIRQNASETDEIAQTNPQAMNEKIARPDVKSDSQTATEVDVIIQKASSRYGVDSGLIRRVIEAESNFRQDAVSPKGAMGLMQLMPGTARELGLSDPFDPKENIMAGTRYLKKLLDRYDGSIPHALAAYNWGMGNLDSRRSQMPSETKNYVAKITGIEFS